MSGVATGGGPLAGKRVLVTGVSTRRSIGYAVAAEAQRAGAELLLTSFGRMRTLTERSARHLPAGAEILELDVNDDADLARVAAEVGERWGRLDGVVHSVAHASPAAMSGDLASTPAAAARDALGTSAVSLARLAGATRELLGRGAGASLVSLSFESTVAWPTYDWMGVSKATLEAISRYLARDLGGDRIRVNSVCSGPIATAAASQIPAFAAIADEFARRAPLGWDRTDPGPVAGAVCYLLSDWSRGMTGQILHVDGGCRAVGLAQGA